MSWSDPPHFEEVYIVIKRKGSIGSRIKILEYQIKNLEAEISLERPRNTAVRVVGYDEETSKNMKQLRSEHATLCAEMEEIDAEIKFYDIWRDLFKSISYRERI